MDDRYDHCEELRDKQAVANGSLQVSLKLVDDAGPPPGNMKAIILKRSSTTRPLSAVLSDVPVPEIGPGEVLLEMKACGLCGTDIEKLHGEYTSAMPLLGHEAVGVVTTVGEGVEGTKEGDRVFPHHHVPCRECYYCKHGNETVCPQYKTSNIDPGGFSEYIRVPRFNVTQGGVIPIPSRVGFEEAAMVEPVACCVRALDACDVMLGDTVLVVGAGPVGMMHALLLRSMKADVILSDVVKPRLKFAEGASVGSVVDAGKDDVPRFVKEKTGGRGADLAIVASGSPRAIVQALQSVRKGGTACLFGVPVEGKSLDYEVSKIYNAAMTIRSSYGAVEKDVYKAMDIIASRRVDFRPLMTHAFPLSDFERGVQAMVSGEGMKVIVTP